MRRYAALLIVFAFILSACTTDSSTDAEEKETENQEDIFVGDDIRVVYDNDVTDKQKQTIKFSLERVRVMFDEAGVEPAGVMYVVTSSDSFVEKYVSAVEFTEKDNSTLSILDWAQLSEKARKRGESVRGLAFGHAGIIILNVHKIRSDTYELAHVTTHEWAHILQNQLIGEWAKDAGARSAIPRLFTEATADIMAHYAVTYGMCEDMSLARKNGEQLQTRECTSEEAERMLAEEYSGSPELFAFNAKLLEAGGIQGINRFFTEFGEYTREFFGTDSVREVSEKELAEFREQAFDTVFKKVFGKSFSELKEEAQESRKN